MSSPPPHTSTFRKVKYFEFMAQYVWVYVSTPSFSAYKFCSNEGEKKKGIWTFSRFCRCQINLVSSDSSALTPKSLNTHTHTLTPTMHKADLLWPCCPTDIHFLSKFHILWAPLIYCNKLCSTHAIGQFVPNSAELLNIGV